jgi:23S rRNA pseudouridine1911/1915/1917 synthase
MELVYKIRKPAAIKDFLLEVNVPLKLIHVVNNKQIIKVNNQIKTRTDSVKKGDNLVVEIPDEPIDSEILAENIPLEIQFEDAYVLIVNKPADMPIMPSKTHPSGTLANAVNHYFVTHNIESRIYFINYLDREASGLILIAKHKFIKYLFTTVPASEVKREYYAIVDGILANKGDCIDLPIGRKSETQPKREVMFGGEECQTSFVVVKEFGLHSLVKVTSETGKAHQIRVHFAHFNYPVVGDQLYNPTAKPIDKFLLFSYKIQFRHPVTNTIELCELAMPSEFRDYMGKFGEK